MIALRNGAVALVLLWISAGLQALVAHRMALGPVAPNFLLITLVVASLALSRPGSTAIGFLAGLCEAAIAGVGMAGLTLSRTLVGFVLGSFGKFEFEANFLLAASTAFLATLGAQVLYLFLDPPSNLMAFVLATIGTAMYNGVLAIPLYLAASRLFHVRRP